MRVEPWVSFADVACYLGVSDDTGHRWIQSMGLPAHKVAASGNSN